MFYNKTIVAFYATSTYVPREVIQTTASRGYFSNHILHQKVVDGCDPCNVKERDLV